MFSLPYQAMQTSLLIAFRRFKEEQAITFEYIVHNGSHSDSQREKSRYPFQHKVTDLFDRLSSKSNSNSPSRACAWSSRRMRQYPNNNGVKWRPFWNLAKLRAHGFASRISSAPILSPNYTRFSSYIVSFY